MKPNYETDILTLELILKYCNQISDTIQRLQLNLDKVSSDFIYQNALAMPLLQIGEMSNRLSKSLINKYNYIPWEKIYGMRNRMAHGYDTVDFEMVWFAAIDRIPEVKKYCEEILKDLQNNS